MSEPKAVAERTEQVVPDVRLWSIEDERIGGFTSVAHAVSHDGEVVLVDPLPLAAGARDEIGNATAIVLTAGSHQRSAWRLRREYGVSVWAPALSKEIEEEPDERYGDGDRLPGGLTAIYTPGAGTTQHTLLTAGAPVVAIVPDLLIRPADGEVMLVPDEYAHDPAQARKSVERLLELEFDVLCLSHGAAVTEDPKAAIRRALGER